MSVIKKEKVYDDIRKFLYKYTHEAALTYPSSEDYIDMAKDMHYSKIILRIKFPEHHHMRAGQIMDRVIYDSGNPYGEQIEYKYTVSMGGEVEVVYFIEQGLNLSQEERQMYQWVCDQIFLVYGKQQVVDVLNLMSKIKQ